MDALRALECLGLLRVELEILIDGRKPGFEHRSIDLLVVPVEDVKRVLADVVRITGTVDDRTTIICCAGLVHRIDNREDVRRMPGRGSGLATDQHRIQAEVVPARELPDPPFPDVKYPKVGLHLPGLIDTLVDARDVRLALGLKTAVYEPRIAVPVHELHVRARVVSLDAFLAGHKKRVGMIRHPLVAFLLVRVEAHPYLRIGIVRLDLADGLREIVPRLLRDCMSLLYPHDINRMEGFDLGRVGPESHENELSPDPRPNAFVRDREEVRIAHVLDAASQARMHRLFERVLDLASAEDSDLDPGGEPDESLGDREALPRPAATIVDLVPALLSEQRPEVIRKLQLAYLRRRRRL